MIAKLLRESGQRFNRASDLVCHEWSSAIGSGGICSLCDRVLFENLVKAKIAPV